MSSRGRIVYAPGQWRRAHRLSCGNLAWHASRIRSRRAVTPTTRSPNTSSKTGEASMSTLSPTRRYALLIGVGDYAAYDASTHSPANTSALKGAEQDVASISDGAGRDDQRAHHHGLERRRRFRAEHVRRRRPRRSDVGDQGRDRPMEAASHRRRDRAHAQLRDARLTGQRAARRARVRRRPSTSDRASRNPMLRRPSAGRAPKRAAARLPLNG